MQRNESTLSQERQRENAMSKSGLPSPGFSVAVPPGTHPDASEQRRLITKSIGTLWRYRELLYFFAWRDVKVRYRQAVLGAGWAVIQPLFTMILFSAIFGRMAHMPSNGIPYPIFSYTALLPWTYFSTVVLQASISISGNSSLVTKVYFPRVLLPGGTALASLLDFAIASVLLMGMMFYYRVKLSWLVLLSPLAVLLMVLITTGVSLFTAALTVRFRDIRHLLPFIIQLWMFGTPIIYPATMVPARFRSLLALNPCWGMVESFRVCLLPNQPIEPTLIGFSLVVAIALFAAGLYYFRSIEKSFADII
jgi:homopolymeric O-antigen transport system permease protein